MIAILFFDLPLPMFPKVVSYNRFVELEHEVAIPLAIFIKKVLLGKCTGISFVDSTPLRVCRNQRIHIHKTFKGIAQRGKCSMGWFFGLKLQLIFGAQKRREFRGQYTGSLGRSGQCPWLTSLSIMRTSCSRDLSGHPGRE